MDPYAYQNAQKTLSEQYPDLTANVQISDSLRSWNEGFKIGFDCGVNSMTIKNRLIRFLAAVLS